MFEGDTYIELVSLFFLVLRTFIKLEFYVKLLYNKNDTAYA